MDFVWTQTQLIADLIKVSSGNRHSRGEDFGWKIGNIRGDGPACQELSHLIGERVAIVLKQAIPVTSEDTAEENICRQVYNREE